MGKAVVVGAGAVVVAALGLGACGVLAGAAGMGPGAEGAAGAAPSGTAPSATPGAGAGRLPGEGSGSGPAVPSGPAAPAALGVPAVPAAWEALDQAAAATCPGLGWGVLAAIGRVESDSGRSDAPGVWSGANGSGAEGPMQFEPATFAAYAVVGPGGETPPSPYDPVDAVYSAAHLLCADGAGTAGTLYGAVYSYDHTAAYVDEVLVLARCLQADPGLPTPPATALGFAARQLGVPYRWGGTGDGGYDCSGLVQAAYAAAGVALPRVAQAQFDAGPAVPPATGPLPGDLLFFGASPTDVGHVGIYVATGLMVDAPHTGTVVRVEAVPTTVGAAWGTQLLVGVTRPAP